MTGRVDSKSDRGFCFIVANDGRRFFAHATSFETKGDWLNAIRGDVVSFDPADEGFGDAYRRPRDFNVRLLEAPNEATA